MARVQLVMSDEDRARFAHQARREGMSFSAWMRAAAHDRVEARQRAKPFASVEEVEEFFRECDALAGDGREPDWDEHLRVISESRRRGAADS